MRGQALPEILAPAGSPESLNAALVAGADAVYLGLSALNARRGAKNFSPQELHAGVQQAAERGARIYLTINTLLLESELSEAMALLELAAAAGVSGVIVSDLAVLHLVKNCCPTLPVHASTQMSVHNRAGVAALKALGFSRVVLARELSKREIAAIAGEGLLPLEVFVHGAQCMSVSGQCFLSAVAGGRSGNRGMCAQPCRQAVKAARAGASLSLRDLSLLTPETVGWLRAQGVASMKIEGRMKRPEYVAAAVLAAREARAGNTPDQALLSAVFSRSGHTDAYFSDCIDQQIFGVRERENVLASADAQGKVRALLAEAPDSVPLTMAVTLLAGAPVRLTITGPEEICVTVEGPIPEAARTRATTQENMTTALQKLGGTPYRLAALTCKIDQGLTLPQSALNALRREGIEALGRLRAPKPVPFSPIELPKGGRYQGAPVPLFHIELREAGQCSRTLLEAPEVARVALYPGELCRLVRGGVAADCLHKLAVLQPPVDFDQERLTEQLSELYHLGVKTLVVSGLSGISLGKSLGFSLCGGRQLSVANTLALGEYQALGLLDTQLSPELSAPQIAALSGTLPRGILAYGKMPLMTLRVCPLRESVGCARCKKGENWLQDRTNRRFTLCCKSGTSELYNADTLYLADRLDRLSGLDFFTLRFFSEAPEEVLAILARYRDRLPTQSGEMKGYTRGLYFRGVE